MPADRSKKFKYKAFLSYSHRDAALAKRIHRALEGFRIDKDLIGRETPSASVPETLRPIFRDREEFSAGQFLNEQTRAALEASSFLILLCSPSSARSEYVNQEVLLFKSLGRGSDIIPVITDGTPGNGEDECFPPAMRFKVSAKGAITKRPEDVLAADIRESGDGWTLAIAKVVARLLGLGTDEVFRRAERERRRNFRIRTSIFVIIGILATGGAVFAYQSYTQRRTLAEIESLVARYSIVSPAQGAASGANEGLSDAITAIVNGAARDTRYANALKHLKSGKVEKAESLLRQVAEETAARANVQGKHAAEAYRRLGAIAGLGDPKRAREAYAKALEFDHADPDALYWYGWLNLLAGNHSSAEKSLTKLLEVSRRSKNNLGTYRAHLRLGELVFENGDLASALSHQQSAIEIARRRADEDQNDKERQRDLSISYEKLGDILAVQGNLDEALRSFLKSLVISKRLAAFDTSHAGRQRDLSISFEKVGDVLMTQGILDEALESYRESATIRKRLVADAPENASWQRDHSVSLERIGDVLFFQKNFTDALKTYRESLAVSERLASTDKDNAGWQYDLSVSTAKVGDVLFELGEFSDALKHYRKSLAIGETLTTSDQNNTRWQRSLSVSNNKVADVLAVQGNQKEAMNYYRNTLEIRDRLAKSDPSNAMWQRDLAVSYSKLADAHELAGERESALDALRQGRAIMEKLVKLSPDNADWKKDLIWFEAQISELKK